LLRSSLSYTPAPSLRVVPRRSKDWSLGELAVRLSAGYGLVPDDWQADPVECMLCRTNTGRYAAATVKITAPRQNGKNGILEVRELFGMVVLGEKFLHTAHEVKTARKAFRRIASFFENARQFPELAAMVLEIRKTNGQEAIVLTNGGSIEFIARSSGSGRGFTVDVLVCDEDQELTDEELAALLPTISAAPLGNPQVILTGTPPNPATLDAAKGEVARRVRKDALRKTDPNLLCFDWGVLDGPLPDVDNQVVWHQTNPALGGRLNLAEVQRERKLMSPERFARERLGWWGDPKDERHDRLIPRSVWDDLVADDPPPQDVPPTALAVDMSHDRVVAIGGCWLEGDRPYVELLALDAVVDTSGAVDWLVERAGRRIPVVVDADSPAASMVPDLKARKVKVVVAAVPEVGKACGGWLDDVVEGRLSHAGQGQVDDVLAVARKRPVGKAGRWVWARSDPSKNIAPLAAVTLARYGAVTKTKPRQGANKGKVVVLS
jgi:hypothetical protein